MKIKRLSLIVILFLGSILTISAQDKKMKDMTPEERAAKITEWMKTNLKLADDQVAKVSDINLKYARMNETLKKSSDNGKAKMKKLKSNDSSKDKEMKAVLTADQYKTYVTKKEEIKKLIREEVKKQKNG